MSDQGKPSTFREAIQRGLAAHRRDEVTRHEIREILDAASREAAAVVGAGPQLLFALVGRDLIAKLCPCGPKEVLAEVDIGQVGFDVTLRWGDNIYNAHTASGFSSALMSLLESRATGDKIATLLKRRSS